MTEDVTGFNGIDDDSGCYESESDTDSLKNLPPNKVIDRAISKVFKEMSGELLDEDGIRRAKELVGGLVDVNSLLDLTVRLKYTKAKQLLSIEKFNSSQNDLFSDEVLDKLMAYKNEDGQSSSVKYCDAHHKHHVFNREQQIRNLRKTNRSFETSEMRREVIMPILVTDQDMTTKEAIARLDEKAKRRKAA